MQQITAIYGATTKEARRANVELYQRTAKHMLQCILIAQPCSVDDRLELNGIVKNCVEHWKTPSLMKRTNKWI